MCISHGSDVIILFPFCGAACDNSQSRDNICRSSAGDRTLRPVFRARCVRRRVRGGRRRSTVPPRHRARPPGAHQPVASRRLRLRSEYRGRRRHPDPDAGSVSPQGHGAAGHRSAATGRYGAGMVFLPRDVRQRDQVRAGMRPHHPSKKGRNRSAGARSRSTTPASARRRVRARPVIEQVFIGDGSAAGSALARDPMALRAEALRHPQAHGARRRCAAARRSSTSVLHPAACRRAR